MVSRGTPGTELRRSHLSSSELPSPHGRLSVLAEIGHSPFQNGPLLNGTIPGQADWTRLRPQCRARRPRRGALPLPPSGVLNYIGLSGSPSLGPFLFATRELGVRSAAGAKRQARHHLSSSGRMHPNIGHGLPLSREPTGAGPILRGHLGPLGRSGEIVNLIEIV
jgi:hypothetical protein